MTGGSPPASRAPRSWTPSTGCSAGPASILVAEGAPSRVRGLLAQEKKKVARVVGDTPIYDIVVGDGEGQVPLRKLSAHVMKLPRNLSARRGQRARPADERHGRRPHAGARRSAAGRQADVGQPAPGAPPGLIAQPVMRSSRPAAPDGHDCAGRACQMPGQQITTRAAVRSGGSQCAHGRGRRRCRSAGRAGRGRRRRRAAPGTSRQQQRRPDDGPPHRQPLAPAADGPAAARAAACPGSARRRPG